MKIVRALSFLKKLKKVEKNDDEKAENAKVLRRNIQFEATKTKQKNRETHRKAK